MALRDKLTDPEEIKRRSLEFEQKYAQKSSRPAEEGLEEEDLQAYVMPFQGLGKSVLKAVAEKGIAAGAKALGKAAVKEGVKDAEQGIFKYGKKAMQQEVPGPDYKNENIAFRPTQKPKQEGWERFNFGKKPKE